MKMIVPSILVIFSIVFIGAHPADTLVLSIELADDLLIRDGAFLTHYGITGESPKKIIITSTTGKAVIVTRQSILDFSTFGASAIIEFAGNAQLIVEPGACLSGNGCTVRFTEQSGMTVKKE